MIKRMILIKAKDGLSPAEFRAYYEANHAPLARRLFPMFADYRRNFITEVARRPDGTSGLNFNVITQNSFATERDYQAFVEKISRPEIRAEIAADEEKFMDRSSIWAFTVDETT